MAFWSLILIVLLALPLPGQIMALRGDVFPAVADPRPDPTGKFLPMTNWSNWG